MDRESLKQSHSHSIVLIALMMVIVSLVIYVERDRAKKRRAEELNKEMEEVVVVTSESKKEYLLRPFDPNTVELEQLREMGLTRNEAVSLIRYRKSGKVFNIKEEVIECYNISDSLYFALEPYIVIGEEFRYKKRETQHYTPTPKRVEQKPKVQYLTPTEFLIDTVGIKYLRAIGALSQHQAEVFVKWRDMSGIHTEEELRACYTLSDSVATALLKYVIFTPKAEESKSKPEEAEPTLVNLNRADSAALRSVYGIGEKSVNAIMEYRTKLGGFYSAEQLLEINVVMESNYEKIITQIFVDSCDISKIDVNFASAKEMSSHPYIAPRLRRLLHKRELKGGWSTVEEMIEEKIFSFEEAQRVRPYLHFELQGLN